MTSEDVTMFRKQLILFILVERYFLFVLLLSFRFSYFLSLSLGENNFSEGCILCPLSVFFVVFFGGDTKL